MSKELSHNVFRLTTLLAAVGVLLGCSDLFGPDLAPDVERFVELMNDHRTSVGCPV